MVNTPIFRRLRHTAASSFSTTYSETCSKLPLSTGLRSRLLAVALTESSGMNIICCVDLSFCYTVMIYEIWLLCIWCVYWLWISSILNTETNEMVAVKKIANAFDNYMDAKRTLREIKLLRHLDHENVSVCFCWFWFS